MTQNLNFVFATPLGKACEIENLNVFSVFKPNEKQCYSFSARDVSIKQHPFLFEWAIQNLKDKFPNYRTCLVSLPNDIFQKYFNKTTNRFMYRGQCLIESTKMFPTTKRQRLTREPSSSLDSSFESNSPLQKRPFDLKYHMKSKNVRNPNTFYVIKICYYNILLFF